jgi:hypothetical protein
MIARQIILKNNLVIMYFPGTGGNHLANLIAVSKQYTYNVDYAKYFCPNKKINAHYRDNNDFSIFLYHFGSADEDNLQKIVNTPNSQFIVIGFPENNQLAWKRIKHFNKLNIIDYHFFHDLTKIYKQQYLEKIYPRNWNTIFADDLFSSNNTGQLLNDLEYKLNIDIVDKDFAISIHNQWISNLEETVSTI